ncbi:hypothetical protein AKJ45_03790 [candidate division MSBL1 archaeon SCGC-AAA261F19]|uniref:Transposase IS4-like domain-containing protein n=1 Tax=candidate division MSBL1 archaeon SCGC-AAA261F19 TaxID=1698275 RepID=A0A133V6B9_9EURY|nr:hypothetical protein AKJ45_03790 [candidate division MSBL1 archaeon SCGC-AAA261F19]
MTTRFIQKRLNEYIEGLKNDEIEYVSKDEENPIDWSKYDEAQINEIKDMLLSIRDVVDGAVRELGLDEGKKVGRGRPPYPAGDLAKAVLLQQYFEVPNRAAVGFVDLFKEKLGIEQTFSYKTLERAYDDPHVAMILREVFKMTQEPAGEKEHNFAPDGTGIPATLKVNWARDSEDGENQYKFLKMVAMMGTNYHPISAVEFPDNPAAHESPYFEPLLEETAANYSSIEGVSADAAYLSRDNCNLVEFAGGTPRFYPKEGIILKRRGSWAWTEMLLDFIDDPQQWLRDYHKRSNAESAFSAFKRKFLAPLRKCLHLRRKAEAFSRVIDYNLRRVTQLRRIEGFKVPWILS